MTEGHSRVYSGTMSNKSAPPVLDGRGLARMPTGKLTPAKMAVKKERLNAFLNAYRVTGILSLACKGANIGTTTIRDILADKPLVANDPGEIELRKWFREQFEEAKEDANEALEGEVYRRAVVGVDRPVYSRGELMEYIKEYSDQLLMFLVKRRIPAYREINNGAVVNVGLNVQQNEILQTIVSLPEDELRRLAERGSRGLIPPPRDAE